MDQHQKEGNVSNVLVLVVSDRQNTKSKQQKTILPFPILRARSFAAKIRVPIHKALACIPMIRKYLQVLLLGY